MITFDSVTKVYPTSTRPALDNISLTIDKGDFVFLIGPSGSGKSTFLELLIREENVTEGDIHFADFHVNKLRGRQINELRRRIGYVFQDPEHQFVARTVAEEMAVSGGPQERIDELLHRLRLTHLADANPFTLSGGEKRRLSVATALVNAPALLVLDEPTFGQDPTTFAELVGMVRELTDRGVTVVSITHDELYAHALGDHLVEVR